MTRRDGPWGAARSAGRPQLWLAGALLLAVIGCTHNALTRGQAEDEPTRDRYAVKTVGDVTVVGNADPVAVGGVGLVVGLEGTGGDCAADSYRAMLMKQLQTKKGLKDIKGILSSPQNALVIIDGQIPPGACKGDPIDLDVRLPPGSKATSLRGGYLMFCHLYNYDSARHLSQHHNGGDYLLKGHPIVEAQGAILVNVGLTDGDEAAQLKQGRIWGGGKSRVDQPFGLIMAPDQQFARVSALVADRVNETFHAGLRSVEDKVALAKDNVAVSLRVPTPYRLNLQRYLRVVRLIPLGNVADAPVGEGPDRQTYRQKLATDLLNPAYTVVAALRLEALGTSSNPILKKGLGSPHTLVRFCSAEALAYLGSPSGTEELGKAVVTQPLLRAFGLTALASLDEAVCRGQLREILHTAQEDETRMGAFRALRILDEKDQAVRGELLNESFWVHRVAPNTVPFVHFSTTKRAEVVLFGESPRLNAPFSLLAGEFAVTATEDDKVRCTVSRFPLGGAPARKQCPFELDDVLRTMADLGASYPEVIALMQQAHSTGCLNCRVRCDALPQATSVYELAHIGKSKDSNELVPAGQDLGVTPTLYEVGVPTRSTRIRQQETMLNDRRPSAAARLE